MFTMIRRWQLEFLRHIIRKRAVEDLMHQCKDHGKMCRGLPEFTYVHNFNIVTPCLRRLASDRKKVAQNSLSNTGLVIALEEDILNLCS